MKLLNAMILAGFLALGLGGAREAEAQAAPVFTQAELDQMLAPVALYPDTVLSHVLIAATYPLEIVQAARFSRDNPHLKGEEAVAAVEHMNWDPSVKALVAFPELLDRMDRDIDWTQRLGDAFLVQEDEVVDTIQYLRDQAYAEGNLRSDEHVKVVRETRYIYIEPARPNYIYLPYYDPRYIYGSWRWADYPPYYWHRPAGFSLSIGFHWGYGYRIAPSFYFSAFHWPYRQVVIVNHHHHHHYYNRHRDYYHSGRVLAQYENTSRWQHNPQHRRGVSYHRAVDETRFTRTVTDDPAARFTSRDHVVRDAQTPDGARTPGRPTPFRAPGQSAATAGTDQGAAPVSKRSVPNTGADAGQRSAMTVRERLGSKPKDKIALDRSRNPVAPSSPSEQPTRPAVGRSKQAVERPRPTSRSPEPAVGRSTTPSPRSTRPVTQPERPAVTRSKQAVERPRPSLERGPSSSASRRPDLGRSSSRPAVEPQRPAVTRSKPSVERSRPTVQPRSAPVPTRRVEAPSSRSKPSFERSRPAVQPRSAPTSRSAPVTRPAPMPRSQPAPRSQPVQRAPRPAPAPRTMSRGPSGSPSMGLPRSAPPQASRPSGKGPAPKERGKRHK